MPSPDHKMLRWSNACWLSSWHAGQQAITTPQSGKCHKPMACVLLRLAKKRIYHVMCHPQQQTLVNNKQIQIVSEHVKMENPKALKFAQARLPCTAQRKHERNPHIYTGISLMCVNRRAVWMLIPIRLGSCKLVARGILTWHTSTRSVCPYQGPNTGESDGNSRSRGLKLTVGCKQPMHFRPLSISMRRWDFTDVWRYTFHFNSLQLSWLGYYTIYTMLTEWFLPNAFIFAR